MIGERTEAPHSLRERSPRLRKHLDKLSKCRDFPIELQHMYQRFRRGLNKSLVIGGNGKWNDLASSSSGQEPRAHGIPSNPDAQILCTYTVPSGTGAPRALVQ